MSSVPVQLLIYVIPRPTCFDAPLIMPLTGCLEVSVGMKKSFTLFFIDLCNPNISDVADITVSRPMAGMLISNMIYLPTNVSVVYITLTWTPQASLLIVADVYHCLLISEPVQSKQRKLRHQFWSDAAPCNVCHSSHAQCSRMHDRQMRLNIPNYYRQQYINEEAPTRFPEKLQYRDSFQFHSSSLFDQSSPTQTRTTLICHGARCMPCQELKLKRM
ncbi:unnamed protein product [Rotaria socialis]|uniref:Uncharacterized protein n=1 Tax=Rotaria socialis TaxID=392032 RepID=A0A820TMN0_9BILA|nr:unnamed protein product [Rotaria socialis]